MQGLLEVLEWASLIVYVMLAILAASRWREQRSEAGGWLSATFGILAFVIVAGRFLPEAGTSTLALWLAKFEIAILVLFPFCLHRFVLSLRSPLWWFPQIAATATAAVVLWTLALPEVPSDDGPRSAAFGAFVVAVLVQWTLLSVLATVRLWSAGKGQPAVARSRMRTMAAGAAALNIALIIAATAGSAEDSGMNLLTNLLALASALLFYLGFAPPAAIRQYWRREPEKALRRTQLDLVAATSVSEVVDAVLSSVREVFGAKQSALIDHRGALLATQGLSAAEATGLVETAASGDEPSVMVVPMRHARLVVRSNQLMPFFGRDEVDLLGSLASFLDLALERAELADLQRAAHEELEAASAELEALVYGISHDLKSPIISLLGYVDLLRSDYSERLDDDGRHFLARMEASAEYMQDLLNDLLELSRIGRMQTEPAPVDLTELVQDVATEVTRRFPAARIELSALPVVLMNPVRARQLFTNLIENAGRHGGRDDITIRVSGERTPEEGAVLYLADDGKGIPDVYREKVFGIFERLEEGGVSRTGTGIGLAMCRKILEQIGGGIDIVDAGPGTTFELRFPPATLATSPNDQILESTA